MKEIIINTLIIILFLISSFVFSLGAAAMISDLLVLGVYVSVSIWIVIFFLTLFVLIKGAFYQ